MTFRAARTAHPVRTNDAFRWLLSGSGALLCLSPLLVFNSERLIGGEVNTEAVTLMGFGITSLILAGLTHGRDHVVQTYAAIFLAICLGLSPWLVDYLSHATAAINAWVTSWAILMITMHQAVRFHSRSCSRTSLHDKTAHQLRPITFI